MLASDDSVAYVVTWHDQGRSVFDWFERWPPARALYEEKAQEVAPHRPVEALRPEYAKLLVPGGAVRRSTLLSPAVFHPLWLSPGEPPDQFVCFRRGRTVMPVLGPGDLVEEQVAARTCGAAPLELDRFERASEDDRNRREPPSAIKVTLSAQASLARLSNRSQTAAELVNELSHGEVLWIASALRTRKESALGLQVVDFALHRQVTVDALNIKGGALRDLLHYTRSAVVFRESIDLCDNARFNPFGYIGLAATLRRLDELDDAYDAVKRALRHYPENKHANEVLDAIKRDLDRRPAARRMAA